MRILHLDSGPAWRGGQQQLHSLIGGLKRQGIQQFLAARKGSPLAARAAGLEVPVRALSLSSEWDLISLAGMARLVGSFRPHLVHAHDSRTLGLAVLLKTFGWGGGVVAARRVAFSIRGNPWWKFKYARQTSRVIAVSRYVRDLLIGEGLEARSGRGCLRWRRVRGGAAPGATLQCTAAPGRGRRRVSYRMRRPLHSGERDRSC